MTEVTFDERRTSSLNELLLESEGASHLLQDHLSKFKSAIPTKSKVALGLTGESSVFKKNQLSEGKPLVFSFMFVITLLML